ncbi:MAG: FHA domain-containing protein [Gammaproteobacteria bacterium]|nr:FHA domain-containing protein [Gammaproteobacteria bacterium]NIR99066.1 FHA domain-containing protein [Gammaproteobacteria bacterium]NIT64698.1 FHA domain-containing protein [Gammaproteobacteria bacterium]NIV21656.1 FHA domain-containing protein [Gammaproteobacteria bacterium]NIX10618.1 FHA domain-containing protein [Gammaproteobacteria bacterium]
MPILTIKLGKTLVRELPLARGTLTIGRRASSDVRIHDKTVSADHACIEWLGDPVFIQDLDSTNGTFVNGKRVQRHELSDGDVIHLGRHTLLFSVNSVASAAGASAIAGALALEDVERLIANARDGAEANTGDAVPLPPEIEWVAQDADGVWWGFEREPIPEASGWHDHQSGNYIRIGQGVPSGNWADSLRRI